MLQTRLIDGPEPIVALHSTNEDQVISQIGVYMVALVDNACTQPPCNYSTNCIFNPLPPGRIKLDFSTRHGIAVSLNSYPFDAWGPPFRGDLRNSLPFRWTKISHRRDTCKYHTQSSIVLSHSLLRGSSSCRLKIHSIASTTGMT